MSYATGAYVLAGFLTIWAIYFFTLSREAAASDPRKRLAGVLLLFGLAYAFLAQFGVLVGVGHTINYGETPECEWLLNNRTTTGALETYEYANTCEGNTPPEEQGRLIVVFLWYTWIALGSLALGGVYMFVRLMVKW